MIFSKLGGLRHLIRRSFSVSAAAVRHDAALWSSATLIKVSPAAESHFVIAVDVSKSPEVAASYTSPGQYLHLRLHNRRTLLAISSPPSVASSKGVFEFLVKSIPGSTAELLCRLQKGDVVELTSAVGKGFDIDRISPPEKYQTVLIFATGSGIRLGADKRADVRLYYGARNLNRMAYKERLKDWESTGINIVQVLSQADDSWTGEQGFVQAAFARSKRILSPQSTGAVLCGRRQMTEEVTSILVSDGVATEKILKNF